MNMTTNVLPDWLAALQIPLPGETPGEHLARCAQAFNGVSLTNNVAKLNSLFLVNETAQRAPQVAQVQTNCATFLRAILALAGCTSNFVLEPYPIGAGISLILEAAQQMGCLISAAATPNYMSLIVPGTIIHYAVAGTNDDHVEMVVSAPDPITNICQHVGAGRPGNAVSIETGQIKTSLGRPIQHIILPMNMATAGATVVAPPLVNPTPQPAPSQAPVIINPLPAPVAPPAVTVQIPTPTQASIIESIISFAMKALKWLFTVR